MNNTKKLYIIDPFESCLLFGQSFFLSKKIDIVELCNKFMELVEEDKKIKKLLLNLCIFHTFFNELVKKLKEIVKKYTPQENTFYNKIIPGGLDFNSIDKDIKTILDHKSFDFNDVIKNVKEKVSNIASSIDLIFNKMPDNYITVP